MADNLRISGQRSDLLTWSPRRRYGDREPGLLRRPPRPPSREASPLSFKAGADDPPASETPGRYLVGVDVGGTFTDVLLASVDGEPPTLAKVLSTADPAIGVIAGVREAARRAAVDPAAVELILNGTTVVTNTVVERRGARVGLLTTRGYRYVLEIARSWTPGPVSGWMVWDKPAPLADTRDVRELSGRITADGTELFAHDEGGVRAAVRELRDAGVEAITIAIVHGYARPDVEQQIGEWAAAEASDLPISLASSVLPEMREYERTLVAVANAYVQPAMRRYVRSLEQELRASFPTTNLNIVRSDGGVMSGEDAVQRPIETVFSGPAGGVRAAVHIGRLIGHPDVLSFDVGGTSTDVALSRGGHAAVARRSSLTEYYKVRVPSLDVVAIGAGGGSLAHVPLTGALRVGPESAGSNPGPAAYGRGGGEPTVTDANVVLGYLPSLLAGQMEIRHDLARQAVGRVADRLGVSVEQAARSIIEVINDRMLGGLRLVSVQRGHDPRRFALFAFGGAGPLHANALLELLGSPVAVVPAAPGVFSTYGFLVADVQREFSRSYVRRLSRVDEAELRGIVGELAAEANAWLTDRGFDAADRDLGFQIGMRYFRQGYELPIVHADPAGDPHLLDTIARRFVAQHRQTYQFELEIEPEVVVVRCVAAGRKPVPATRPADASIREGSAQAIADGDHQIYWDRSWTIAPRYDRTKLEPGHHLAGPAVIEQEDSTTLVHPGFGARVDALSNLLIERLP
ncbi:hydantoinase/oxoprolinase family protein [Baekduia soli]|uniref:Hydantoinase/oxoprolinase family protein n=1 Tax=Baekduia soli TaxID=496014 RepID=A0A5B8U2P2_9ACTN|nr:hydantoinase/oxoprolinase family protein [Baekduia soli]QEC47284.1 hydantoinase/oxoprolinase family protein [Baekduia soli]